MVIFCFQSSGLKFRRKNVRLNNCTYINLRFDTLFQKLKALSPRNLNKRKSSFGIVCNATFLTRVYLYTAVRD